MEKNKNLNKKNIMFYLSKHKLAVIFYVLLIVIGCAASGLMTISFAQFLSKITTANFEEAIRVLIFVAVITMVWRFSWYVSYIVYYKYSNKIWVEIAEDLTKRSFELSSSTFSDNESGSFVQRIITDPNNVLSQLSTLVELITETITSFVIIIYITTLNWIIGLLYVVVLVSLMFLELKRKRVGKANRTKSKKVSDKTYSIVNEIIKSEKDIKSLGLEEKLCEVSKDNLNSLKNANMKHDIVDTNFWNFRCVVIDIFAICILFLGIYMMDIGSLTLASYILLYSYRNSLYELVWCLGSIAKNLNEVSVSSNRMFSLYDEKLYKSDKFGTEEIKNIKANNEC